MPLSRVLHLLKYSNLSLLTVHTIKSNTSATLTRAPSTNMLKHTANFTLSHHFATTATYQIKPVSDQKHNKSTRALRASNNEQVNLTSLLLCNAVTPCSSNVTVAPSLPRLIVICMESLTQSLFSVISATYSILYDNTYRITVRGRRRRRRRGRQRRPHHIQKTSYYEGDYLLLFSQHNVPHLFIFISPNAFHGSSYSP